MAQHTDWRKRDGKTFGVHRENALFYDGGGNTGKSVDFGVRKKLENRKGGRRELLWWGKNRERRGQEDQQTRSGDLNDKRNTPDPFSARDIKIQPPALTGQIESEGQEEEKIPRDSRGASEGECQQGGTCGKDKTVKEESIHRTKNPFRTLQEEGKMRV